ncbi:CLUMA_CG008216, isoform A [Clunio marinus]|uniref:CLUMA_CG008216, isoform A n=1 Tax=Clunio marinus TaxID=568069 RepID=A0A1J1I550_9DIPT|nr:CLUMA_CG008216, isoform A [Clunio marinus]
MHWYGNAFEIFLAICLFFYLPMLICSHIKLTSKGIPLQLKHTLKESIAINEKTFQRLPLELKNIRNDRMNLSESFESGLAYYGLRKDEKEDLCKHKIELNVTQDSTSTQKPNQSA